jgi:hypothetical protein
MNPAPLTLWDRTQLAILRVLSITLGWLDWLLNVHWGERLLNRLSGRWQARLDLLNASLADLEEERHRIQVQAEALAIQAATIYLGGRSLIHNELRFDPAIAHDEEMLDASIDLLVKQRLATIESVETEPGRFVYHLEPDWAAIHRRLSAAAEQAEPESAEWFLEGIRLIEETLLSHGTLPGNAMPENSDLE